MFYRLVESRWLTLISALKKVEEKWDQSKQYFMEFLTSKKDFKKTTQQNPRYQRIAAFFRKEKFTLVQLEEERRKRESSMKNLILLKECLIKQQQA